MNGVEDVCNFISVTDKQKEYLKPMVSTKSKLNKGSISSPTTSNYATAQTKRQTLSSANTYKSSAADISRGVPTGMSNYIGHPDSNDAGSNDGDNSFDLTVHIPDAFKKTRKEKINDTSNVLTRLQGLMSDIRAKEV